MINKSIRELDRERTALQNSEKKLITDIKKAAKDGQMVHALSLRSCMHASCALSRA